MEIAKAISQNAKMLIMDEPSAPLTHTEVHALYAMVEKLKAAGVTIVYISHRMDEIFRLSDRVTVLRDGQKVKTMNTADTNLDDLVKLMVGRELKETYPSRPDCITDEVLLTVENVSGDIVSDINLEIKRGEVLGLAGLIGSGRTELAEMLFGYKKMKTGRVTLEGKEVTPRIPKQAIATGIALVPEDRKKLGALLDFSIKENISIAVLERISKFFTIDTEGRTKDRRPLQGIDPDQDSEPRAENQKPQRRQPAKGHHRQVARHPSHARHFRRTHTRHRCRREIRDLRTGQQPRGIRQSRPHDFLRNGRGHGHVRPHHRSPSGENQRRTPTQRLQSGNHHGIRLPKLTLTKNHNDKFHIT